MSNPFNYPDTNSSRAGIETLNERFHGQNIAIIGLGGTGSYILDLVVKSPVAQIHLFDGDVFELHNAFRSPGAPDVEDFVEDLKKVTYFCGIYSRMHRNIIPHTEYITIDNIGILKDFNFVFVCVDKNSVRTQICSALVKMNIPFVDCGLGVDKLNEQLISTIRVTTATPDKYDHLSKRFGSEDRDDDLYASNIQIADLNCMNAAFAVIKWKRWSGYYQDLKKEHNSFFTTSTNKIINEDNAA